MKVRPVLAEQLQVGMELLGLTRTMPIIKREDNADNTITVYFISCVDSVGDVSYDRNYFVDIRAEG